MVKKMIKLIFYFEEKKETSLEKKEYKKDFGLNGKSHKDKKNLRKRAFAKAWEIRNFEIELYWKRATYFWAFMITIFAAFGLTLNQASEDIEGIDFFRYLIICTGLVVSFAWQLTNRGSKSWMRSWEKHIDMLEDEFTGPLYKTVGSLNTFSVSKINEIVSCWFIFLWSVVLYEFLSRRDLVNFSNWQLDGTYFFPSLFTFFFIFSMFYGYGRGRFGFKEFEMFRRDVDV